MPNLYIPFEPPFGNSYHIACGERAAQNLRVYQRDSHIPFFACALQLWNPTKSVSV